jgi:hypothetical protein
MLFIVVFMLRLDEILKDFILSCNPSDVKRDKGMHLWDSCSSEEIDRCVGGVDFITLV